MNKVWTEWRFYIYKGLPSRRIPLHVEWKNNLGSEWAINNSGLVYLKKGEFFALKELKGQNLGMIKIYRDRVWYKNLRSLKAMRSFKAYRKASKKEIETALLPQAMIEEGI